MDNVPNDEQVMLSALQHYVFCPRQCALIHVEQVWSENAQTAKGHQNHERAHAGGSEERGGVKTLRGLQLFSQQHRLWGVADVVELHGERPIPVEYKSGKAKPRLADEIQLCAQAICLEEMFGYSIPQGFIYHAASHKRREVAFTPALREEVLNARDGVLAMMQTRVLPEPAADERCQFCSLIYECEPFAPRNFPRGFDPFSTLLEE
ncbi:CRISPR-associated protein Cas4 [Deinococcus wulumuqiensis]|uniref:CRISPR-associated exonuclease Cas4 n=1 Tax=Deinococcus wulumuqiensis TaxID=980427 RepID=A0AAV4K757_9DEIO|nr:CRISPR-associated protein Cas4 [Deinococcus wulumuqiensis]QII22467.1 CRISPR-associated protein Cas4 [Deinococcus wulumuqiensis R12]GGI85621.1 CRISPR-associated protein Cas4 [Deinococcus wulumuqiensis]GGP30151.1 CRISPR-associated protein Cas4 [Deinococcus wulumuqiensis]